MFGFVIPTKFVLIYAAHNAFSCNDRRGPNQHSDHNRVFGFEMNHLHGGWRILLFFCFAVALSGCGTPQLQTTDPERALSINATSVGFGDVVLNSVASQSVILTAAGAAPVTVNAATVTGVGFTLTPANLPVTLSPGEALTLVVQFDPAATGAATGQLTITSDSSTGATSVIGLSGTGAPHEVDLSWIAPSSPYDPIAGYNIYRAPSGSSSFQLLNSLDDNKTSYVDSPVQSGQGYSYFVTSVDISGTESVPSDTISVTIP
jgi:hypothetical protein